MTVKKINVLKPRLPDRKLFDNYIDQIYENVQLTNNGGLVRELEERLATYLNVRNIVLVANGTLALQLAFKLLKLEGEVITTPFSFVATSSSLIWENLLPVFADINGKTLNIDLKAIKKKISDRTSAILPVHVFGNACEAEALQQLADEHDLKLIFDASHAFDISYKNDALLNHGDISTISFHATKLFHTVEGGALIIKDDEVAERARRVRNFGYENSEIHDIGINAKMSELHAAVGLCILDTIPVQITRNKKKAEYYRRHLPQIIEYPTLNQDATFNYHYFPVIFQSEDELLKVKRSLNLDNIYPRRYFYPSLNTLPYLQTYEACPVSEDISRRILCLPIYEDIEEDVQQLIINRMKECLC